MLGRVLFGDTKIAPPLTQFTGIELEAGEHPVHLACSAPATVLADYDALQVDLVEEVARRLRKREIPVTPPDEVLEHIDALGGRFDARELAAQFDEGLLIHLDIERFSLVESSGSDLHRGRLVGELTAYELREATEDGTWDGGAVEIFTQEVRLEYPSTHPLPADQVSPRMFKRKFMAALADEIGRRLYSYRVSDTF